MTSPTIDTPTREHQALSLFFEKIKTMGFMARLFHWKPFLTLSFEAYAQYQSLSKVRQAQQDTAQNLTHTQQQLQQQLQAFTELKGKLEQSQIHEQARQKEILHLQEKQQQLHDKYTAEKEDLAHLHAEKVMLLQRLEQQEKELSNVKVGSQKDDETLRQKHAELSALKGELQHAQQLLEEKSNRISALQEKIQHHEQSLLALASEKATLTMQVQELQKRLQGHEKSLGQSHAIAEKNQEHIDQLSQEKMRLNHELNSLRQQLNQAHEKLLKHEERAETQQQKFDDRMAQVNALKSQLDNAHERLRLEQEHALAQQLEAMKAVWQSHETAVETRIQDICNRHHIESVHREKVPFKGKPDNTLRIAGEYLIFDAKAPLSDDLKTFGNYIRNAAEQLKKYATQEGVKKDLFLVIPNNTATSIKENFLNLSDYRVFVVTLDALEPIILSLLKIEEYEFTEQLSPEERAQISRVIGKFAHAAKRKIQIDSYLNSHFLSLLEQCDQLPENFLTEAQAYEKSDKLNPPMEKRIKTISLKETQKSVKKLQASAQAENIPVGVALTLIDQIPVEQI